MYKLRITLWIVGSLLIGGAGIYGCASSQQPLPPATVQTVPTVTPKPAAMHEWILIDLPAGASQLEYGAEVYRLVCQDCHGNRGQGLTDEWRATWAPADQNCWQSKCHAANHPPEGFVLPMAPAVAGPAMTSRFATALELHDFIQKEMPWYRPGSLTEKDGWAVAAHILQLNHIEPGLMLSAQSAAQVALH
ncbi:MAG: c-type cytochrome [Anaerolineales bacterium]